MIRRVRQFDSLLADRFAADLLQQNACIWRKGDDWYPDASDTVHAVCSDSVRAEIASVISAAVRSGVPILKSIADGRLVWVHPLSETHSAAAAVRFCSPEPEQLIELLNRTSLLAWKYEKSLEQSEQIVIRQEQQLTAFAAQVTEDLEELTWLRQLAGHLELSESGNNAEQILHKVMPGLCELIGASTLIFLRDQAANQQHTTGPGQWQTGRIRVPHEVCQQIVYELAGRGDGSPIVVNNWGLRLRTEGFSGIRSCILVPVVSERLSLGWLIAVNKDLLSGSRFRGGSPPGFSHDLSETEFGTFEASLMSATAVILAAHGRNCGLLQEKELLLRGVIRSLINAIDAKDSYTCGHSDRVAELSRMIARSLRMNEKECDQIYMTGLLHDVGKIGVPDDVLQKPGRLTDDEFALIKQHPVIGYEILKHIENFRYVLPGVLYHHEALDGSGYPHGLTGNQIPLEARILAVADAYDAMTTDRTYRRGMPTAKAEQILLQGAGTQWDPDCVQAFFRSIHGVRLITAQPGVSPAPALVSK